MRRALALSLFVVACVACGGKTPTPEPEVVAETPIDAAVETVVVPPDAAPAPPDAAPPPPLAVAPPPRTTMDARELRKQIKAAKDDLTRLTLTGQLADVVWTGTCKALVDGLCIEARPRSDKQTYCEPRQFEWVAKARTGDTKEALGLAKGTLALWAKDGARAELAAITDADEQARRGAAAGEAVALARLISADTALEHLMALPGPGQLDFEKDGSGAAKKFEAWWKEAQQRAQKATELYQTVIADDELTARYPFAAVRVLGRAYRIYEHVTDALLSIPVPSDVVRSGLDATALYCGTIKEKADPIWAVALSALDECVQRATDTGVTGPYKDYCVDTRAAVPGVGE